MKNKLVDLNNHLFAQLERLGDESIDAVKLDEEVKRAHAIAAISTDLIKIASLQVQAAKIVADYGQGDPTKYLPVVEDHKAVTGAMVTQ